MGASWEGVVVFLVMFIAIIGPSAVIAIIGFSSLRALGRNPSAGARILRLMIGALLAASILGLAMLILLFLMFGR